MSRTVGSVSACGRCGVPDANERSCPKVPYAELSARMRMAMDFSIACTVAERSQMCYRPKMSKLEDLAHELRAAMAMHDETYRAVDRAREAEVRACDAYRKAGARVCELRSALLIAAEEGGGK